MHLTSRMENVTFLKLSEAGMFLSCTIKRFISKIDPAHGIFCFMMMLFRAGIFHFFALLTVLYPSEILSYAFSFILHPMTQILRLFFFFSVLQCNWAEICHVPYHGLLPGESVNWLTYANENYTEGCVPFLLNHKKVELYKEEKEFGKWGIKIDK